MQGQKQTAHRQCQRPDRCSGSQLVLMAYTGAVHLRGADRTALARDLSALLVALNRPSGPR